MSLRFHRGAWFACALIALGGAARAQTPLVTVELAPERVRVSRIDERPARDAEEAALDAALGAAIGQPDGFTTHALDRVYEKLQADLRRERPRAPARLLLFLYPGRVGAAQVKTLSEVAVDLELTIDPCDRTVCRGATARHIELMGRAIGSPTQTAPRYKILYRTLTLRTVTQLHEAQTEIFRMSVAESIAASRKAGGGMAWLDRRSKAAVEYEPLVTRSILRQASRRRLVLASSPRVVRKGSSVEVRLEIEPDRIRGERRLLDAFAAAGAGLAENPSTPPESEVEVLVRAVRGSKARRFRAPARPIGDYLAGRVTASVLRSTYIAEVTQAPGAQQLSFDDGDASSESMMQEPDDAEAVATLSRNFEQLRGCVAAEARKSARFAGATLVLEWHPSGRARGKGVKEQGLRGGELERCLTRAVGAITMPRFSGAPRTIEYPIVVKQR